MITTKRKHKTTWDVVRERIEEFDRHAAKAFRNHTIRMRLDQGLFRSWRCQPFDGGWIYGFDIHTMPGMLMVTGDIGMLALERTADMLSWARGSIHSIDYFAEKVCRAIKTDEFDQKKAEVWVKQHFRELRDSFGASGAKEERKRLVSAGFDRDSLLFSCENEHEFATAVIESEIAQGCDFPNVRNYNANFLWCRAAIKWFLDRELQDYAI